MRKVISDEVVEIAKKHEKMEERIEIYWKMMMRYIEEIMVDERMRKYLDPNRRRREKMIGNDNSHGTTVNRDGTTVKNSGGTTVKNRDGTTVKSKSKPKKNQISEEAITIYISNNNVLYDIVYKFIYSNINTWNISYLINKHWEQTYLYTQMKEAEKIINQVWLETFTTILSFIKQDDFRNKQILTIKKLNKKDSDGVPYYILMMEKIKNYKPKVISIPTV